MRHRRTNPPRQMNRLLIILFSLTIFGCSNSGNINVSTKDLAFKKFISRQKLIDLPVHFDIDNISDSLTEPMIVNESDTLFISPDLASGRIYGLYKDTSKYFLFLNLGAASIYIPEIMTFDKHGNQIQYEQMLIDGYGSDCGYYIKTKLKKE